MKSQEKKTVVETKIEESKKAKEYFEIPLPKFSFRPGSYTPLLVISLVIASFFIGMLTTKVQYLEKAVGGEGVFARQQGDTTAGTTPENDTKQVGGEISDKKVDVDEGNLPVLGNKNAKVTLVEFSDFQCPFCKRLFDDTIAGIKKDYIDTGKVKLAYRHYPLPFHANAQKAAQASECANEQDAFWKYHDILFNKQTDWEKQAAADAATTFANLASEQGLNIDQFNTCLSSGKFEQKVKDDAQAGTSANVSATPTVFVNGRAIVGAQPYDVFKKAIEEELKK